jgi:hypothetical protein
LGLYKVNVLGISIIYFAGNILVSSFIGRKDGAGPGERKCKMRTEK